MLSNYSRKNTSNFFNSICPIQSYLNEVLDNSTNFSELSLFNTYLFSNFSYFLTKLITSYINTDQNFHVLPLYFMSHLRTQANNQQTAFLFFLLIFFDNKSSIMSDSAKKVALGICKTELSGVVSVLLAHHCPQV